MAIIRLPPAWPAAFPVPSGAFAVADESDGDVLRVVFETLGPTDLERFFLTSLIHAGWDVALVESSGSELAFEIEGDGFFGQVEIETSGRRFAIQLV